MSQLVTTLLWHIRVAKLPEPTQELRFDPVRRWRFDLAWPAVKLACEIEGGIWTGGRHVQPTGFEQDCEKYNSATLQGWRVIRVTSGMIRDGRALKFLQQALGATL